MNLPPLLQRLGLPRRLQHRGKAVPVHTRSLPPHPPVHKESLVRVAAARDFSKELVGEAGFGVGDAGEDGEGVVEAGGREDAGGEGQLEEEERVGAVELGAEDLGVELFQVVSGGGGREGGGEGGGGGVGREGGG